MFSCTWGLSRRAAGPRTLCFPEKGLFVTVPISAVAEVEKAQGSRPKTFKDYRELLDTPGLEAVIIATPPHWHALPFLAACRKGLDIYW